VISPILAVVGRYALTVSLVFAAAVLVKGYTAAGDGFAAGAVVAVALGLQIVAGGREQATRQPLLRHSGAIALGGLALALAVTFAPLLFGDAPMTHWPPPGEHVTKIGSIELISAVAFDVGVFLLVIGAVGGMLGLLADPQLDDDDEGAAAA
jgi:multisubunit Na+/H+ antiporter MnhB subunit